MDELLKAAMSGFEEDKSIVPKVTKTTTEETTSFVRLEKDEKKRATQSAKKGEVKHDGGTEPTTEETQKGTEKEEEERRVGEDGSSDEHTPPWEEVGEDGRSDDYPPPWERPWEPHWRNPNWGNNYYSNYSNYGGRRPHHGNGYWRGNYGGRPHGYGRHGDGRHGGGRGYY